MFAQDTTIGEGCDLRAVGATEKQSFFAFDRELRDALTRQDAGAMALLIEHPLRVNSARGKYLLEDPRSLQLRFQEVFPPAVRNAVLKYGLDNIFCSYNGIMYGNGELWVDVLSDRRFHAKNSSHYAIKSVNLHDSSPDEIPNQPKLEFVCETEKHRIIVDTLDRLSFHYRAWNKPRAIAEKPDLELTKGTFEFQGTGVCSYGLMTFTNANTNYILQKGLGCLGGNDVPAEAIGQLEVTSRDKTLSTAWCY